MHKLIIHKLGPVDQCELECVPFFDFDGISGIREKCSCESDLLFQDD